MRSVFTLCLNTRDIIMSPPTSPTSAGRTTDLRNQATVVVGKENWKQNWVSKGDGTRKSLSTQARETVRAGEAQGHPALAGGCRAILGVTY